MIVVDTNVISELMRQIPDNRVLTWIDDIPKQDIAITAITVAEILYGIGSLPDGKKRRRLVDAVTAMFDEYFFGRIHPFDRRAAVEYADIVIQRENLGAPISIPDARIAAICRSMAAGFATRNTKDFGNIGLVLIDPWRA